MRITLDDNYSRSIEIKSTSLMSSADANLFLERLQKVISTLWPVAESSKFPLQESPAEADGCSTNE